MPWFKSDPANVAAREAANAITASIKAAMSAYIDLNEIIKRGSRQGGVGPTDLKRAMELFDKLDRTVDFRRLFNNIIYLRIGKLKLVKKLIDKVKELGVDLPLGEIILKIHTIPKMINLMENSEPEKDRSVLEENKKTVLVLNDYAKYLRGENDNSGANAPAASMKPASAPAASMKQANASMKPANAPNAPLNQGKLEDGLQRLEMDLKEEGTSLNFIVDKEATPSLYRYGKMVLGQAPATSMQAAPAPAPAQAAPTKLTFAERKAARYGAPAASMPQATMATGGMRSRKRRNSKTKKGRTSKSKTPRKAKK